MAGPNGRGLLPMKKNSIFCVAGRWRWRRLRLGFFVRMVERKGKIKIKISLINLFNKKLEGNFDKVLATFKFVAKTI